MSAITSSSPRTRLIVLAILVLAAGLRLWTVDSGIPHTVAVDEPAIMNRSIAIMQTGDFNPHFFDYGGLMIYVHAAVASVRFAAGALSRRWTAIDQVWAGDFYLWARILTALIGTMTVYVTYRAALRWGVAVALISALMMAVQPNHVLESHKALTDIPLTFFVALTFLLSLVAAEEGRLRWFLVAGVAAGLATSTKYNGALALIMPVTVALTVPAIRLRSFAIAAAVGGTLLAFLVSAPYSVLDLPHFLNGFASLATHYSAARSPSEVAGSYLAHLRTAFGVGKPGLWALVGWPAMLFCLAGALALVYQTRLRSQRAPALAVLVYSVAYFWLITHQSLIFARYALPIVPMICLALGVGITTICRALSSASASDRTRRQILAVLLILIVPPTIQAVQSDWQRRKISSEELMARWMQANLDPKALVISEATMVSLPPNFRFETTNKLFHETVDAYRQRGVAYLVACDCQSNVYFNDEPHYQNEVALYRRIFAATDIVKIQQPTDDHPGSKLTVLKIRN